MNMKSDAPQESMPTPRRLITPRERAAAKRRRELVLPLACAVAMATMIAALGAGCGTGGSPVLPDAGSTASAGGAGGADSGVDAGPDAEANAPDAGEWFPAHRVVRDIVPGVGALSALQTAMVAGHGRTVVVCAWDMPFVNAELLEALVTAVESGSECCVPLHDDGRLEPLCAAYAAECADAATWLLDAGERAAHALADAVGGTRWPVNDLSADRDGQRTFFNVNTPADLTRAADWIDFLPELS